MKGGDPDSGKASRGVSKRLFRLCALIYEQSGVRLDAAAHQGASTIVHFRQLLKEALRNDLCLDTEGKGRDLAPLSGREPRNGPSLLFPVSTRRHEDSYDCRESKTVHFRHPHPKNVRTAPLVRSAQDHRKGLAEAPSNGPLFRKNSVSLGRGS